MLARCGSVFLLAGFFLAGCTDDALGPCEPGTLGCACRSGGEPCKDDDALCEAGTCVACEPGSQGCGCLDGDVCLTGGTTCRKGRCVSDAEVPADPVCYTPCLQGRERDGEYVPCSAEGLMAGCLADYECVQGSCVKPSEQPERCATDSQCPDYQTCIAGRCYSDCDGDADCPEGRGCHRHVCRVACNTAAEPCRGVDRVCLTYDGENGYCMPSAGPGDGPVQKQVEGTFLVEPLYLSFTNIRTGGRLQLVNEHPAAQEFVVHRKRHVEYDEEGRTEVTDREGTPLHWLVLRGCTEEDANGDCRVRVEAGSGVVLEITEAANPVLPRWDGELEVISEEMGVQEVLLSYAQRPDGAWSGSMYYFASFRDTGLDEWLAGTGSITGVQNAFVNKWVEFKEGTITLDEFLALLTSTVTESWKWAGINAYPDCEDENIACFPYDNPQGFSTYTPNLRQFPIPTGAVEFPVSMNLRQPDPNTEPERLKGRIVTDSTLHYVGDRDVTIVIEGDPAACTANAAGVVLCSVEGFQADVLVGGRYGMMAEEDPGDWQAACELYGGRTYGVVKTPWLVPGFVKDTVAEDGRRYRVECRDRRLPYGPGAADLNQGQAAANPIPDGRTRVREIRLVDGALVNGEELLILFRESFVSFMGAGDDEGFSAYGIMRLEREAADLELGDFIGSEEGEDRTFDPDKLRVGCSSGLLEEIRDRLGLAEPYDPEDPADVDSLARTVVEGGPDPQGPTPLDLENGPEKVHFFCADTGLIDNLSGDGGQPMLVPCPEGSEVRYFTLTPVTATQPTSEYLAGLGCKDDFRLGSDIQYGIKVEEDEDGYVGAVDSHHETVHVDVINPGSCWEVIESWMAAGGVSVWGIQLYDLRMDPVWRCQSETVVTCSDDRLDLREGKLFYPEEPANPGESPLAYLGVAAAVQDAFRYKTRFRSRTGAQVGFTPTICQEDSMAIPYCYDPGAIDELTGRVDCAVHLYTRHCPDPAYQSCPLLEDFLKTNFAFEEQKYDAQGNVLEFPRVHEGFERLYAELLIMLGDDAYTRAMASRFDLAGSALSSFEGKLFEPPDGMDLSGGAGYEMVNLYRAAQYYQIVLDRFYALSPTIWRSLEPGSQAAFITNDTVTAYFNRLIRASTQKSRAWSEVAKRYLQYNRPDLARRVVQRAYTATYLESVVLSRMMLRIEKLVGQAQWPEISRHVELAQMGYRAALLDMRQVYGTISDEVNLFGFPPEYIPFPALSRWDINAFTKILATAKEKMAVAASKEEAALAASRSYETDAAAFQSELVGIRNNYENQLADLCGTFVGDDGRVYPSIPKYAEMNENTRLAGNPCGVTGNGQLFESMVEAYLISLDIKEARMKLDDKIQEIEYEKQRVSERCDLIAATAKYVFETQQGIDAMRNGIQAASVIKETAARGANQAASFSSLEKCSGPDCASGIVSAKMLAAAYTVANSLITGCDIAISVLEDQIRRKERDRGKWVTERECDYALVESNARVKTLLLELDNLGLDILRQLERYKLELSKGVGLFNQARRIMDEQAESEQLAINVAAARNDPNVRIYKNDAVLTADRTFYDTLQEAYRATKVYEYYTSQSYAPLCDLFLVRMVSHGDVTLESYLRELENEFYLFEEQYGNPDLRVEVLSLRDDILAVPRYGDDGKALSDGERTRMMREKLADVRLLDARGYITIPFATKLSRLCPLTRNHKIQNVEAQLYGAELGDAVARVYLSQRGTGTVRGVGGDKIFYRFPDRTAVIDAVVGEQRVFDSSVYATERLRDRPMVNSHWELLINQKDEAVNQDVNLQSLDDIYVYVYYTDFTEL